MKTRPAVLPHDHGVADAGVVGLVLVEIVDDPQELPCWDARSLVVEDLQLSHGGGGCEVHPAGREDVVTDGHIPGLILAFDAPALEDRCRDELAEVGFPLQGLGASEGDTEVVEDPSRGSELRADLEGNISVDPRRSGVELVGRKDYPLRREVHFSIECVEK